MSYSVIHVDDIEASGPGGAARFVRRELGVNAFGINWFELPPNTAGREHSEADSKQEEVNVCVRGAGVYRIEARRCPSVSDRSFASIPTRRVSRSPGLTE